MKKTFEKTRLAAILTAMLVLSSCGGFNGAEDVLDVERAHPISVQPDIVTLVIPAEPYKESLSPADRGQVENIAQAFKERGHGPLTIATPSGTANTGSALNLLSEIREVLDDRGIGENAIEYAPYNAAAADGSAPVILSFKRFVASASPCGDWSRDYAFNPSNGYTPNHGCATQNNLAAVVADPADLINPRNMTPAEAARRNTVVGKYHRGEVTSAQKDASDSASVSQVAK